MRHLDVGVLWLQEQAVRRRLPLEKVLGTENPADLMTKHLSRDDVNKYLRQIGIEFVDGRASTALKVYSLQGLFGGREKDFWEHSAKRNHLKMRKSLFTPIDVVSGSEGRNGLGGGESQEDFYRTVHSLN